jgi:hypothetical protein
MGQRHPLGSQPKITQARCTIHGYIWDLRTSPCPRGEVNPLDEARQRAGWAHYSEAPRIKKISEFMLTLASTSPSVGGMGVLSSRPAGISTGDPGSLRAGALAQAGGRT